MKRFMTFAGLGLLLLLPATTTAEPVPETDRSTEPAVEVTIIYDNYQADERLETDWGFACLVEAAGEKLLFDTGNRAELYKKNVQTLGIDPSGIPSLFISHSHGDHTAGIPWVREVNPSVHCYLPASWAEQLKEEDKLPPNSTGIENPLHLYGPFYSTGDRFEAFREQGLVVRTGTGGVLITGCGHPGPVEMVEKAEKELGIEIHTLIGGLHLLQKSDAQLEQIAKSLKELGIEKICPTHCTGDHSRAYLKKAFGEGYIPGGTGAHIVIN
jgi:7,8-dihydropterin-6-yl-methyl-4-(beta-D-ribofuranosyl)aminobenzene 5'-phosphate synthase